MSFFAKLLLDVSYQLILKTLDTLTKHNNFTCRKWKTLLRVMFFHVTVQGGKLEMLWYAKHSLCKRQCLN